MGLAHHSKLPVTQLGRALGHLQTGTRKGFASAAAGQNSHLQGAGQRRALAEDVPTPGYLAPARPPVTALSQQQGSSGSAVEAPRGALDTSPPHLVALPCSKKTAACLLSAAPNRGAKFSAVPAARGKKPTRVVQSGVDHRRFLPQTNTLGRRVTPAGPQPRGSAEVSIHGQGEAAAPQPSSSSVQPKYNLGKACDFQLHH